jgi:hypothetical protein
VQRASRSCSRGRPRSRLLFFWGSHYNSRTPVGPARVGGKPRNRKRRRTGNEAAAIRRCAGIAHCCLSRSACPGHQAFDLDRGHRRGLVSDGRRDGERPHQAHEEHRGHGRGHGGKRRQRAPARFEQDRGRLLDGGYGLGGRQRPRQVQGQGADAHHRRGPPARHACRERRRPRHRQDGRPQGQADLDRIAGQRHRGDGAAHPGSVWHPSGQGHPAPAPERGRGGQCGEGSQRPGRSSSSSITPMRPRR